jgi:hypothetical protein
MQPNCRICAVAITRAWRTKQAEKMESLRNTVERLRHENVELRSDRGVARIRGWPK